MIAHKLHKMLMCNWCNCLKSLLLKSNYIYVDLQQSWAYLKWTSLWLFEVNSEWCKLCIIYIYHFFENNKYNLNRIILFILNNKLTWPDFFAKKLQLRWEHSKRGDQLFYTGCTFFQWWVKLNEKNSSDKILECVLLKCLNIITSLCI